MKKLLSLIILGITFILIFSIFYSLDVWRTAPWERELTKYIESITNEAETVKIVSVNFATKPFNFKRAMASIEYVSKQKHNSEEQKAGTALILETPDTANMEEINALEEDSEEQVVDIPPIVEIRCVLLEHTINSSETIQEAYSQEIFLVGHHARAHGADGTWVIYKLADELTNGIPTPKSKEILSTLGCKLGLDIDIYSKHK